MGTDKKRGDQERNEKGVSAWPIFWLVIMVLLVGLLVASWTDNNIIGKYLSELV